MQDSHESAILYKRFAGMFLLLLQVDASRIIYISVRLVYKDLSNLEIQGV